VHVLLYMTNLLDAPNGILVRFNNNNTIQSNQVLVVVENRYGLKTFIIGI